MHAEHLVSAMLLALLIANANAKDSVAIVEVSGPTIVAFLPAGTDKRNDGGSREAIAHVRFALADTRKCLGKYRATLMLVFADAVILKTRSSSSRTIQLTDKGQGVGAILLFRDRMPKYIVANHGLAL